MEFEDKVKEILKEWVPEKYPDIQVITHIKLLAKKQKLALLDRVEEEVVGEDEEYPDIDWDKQSVDFNLGVTLGNILRERQRKILKKIRKSI